MKDGEYRIEQKGSVLIFSTASFGAGSSSMLHGGVFSRELAASLTAGAVTLAVVFVASVQTALSMSHFAGAGICFALLFVLLRLMVFREPSLKMTIDGDEGSLTVVHTKVIGGKEFRAPMSQVSGPVMEQVTQKPDNRDGAEVVERIALGHGMVMPGFADGETSYSIGFDVNGEHLLIFRTRQRDIAETLVAELNGFLRGNGRAAGREA